MRSNRQLIPDAALVANKNIGPQLSESKRSLGIGYLVSRYPAVSHTFILNEVVALRKLGHRVETASINEADAQHSAMTLPEQLEAHSTFYVKKQGGFRAVAAGLRLFVRRPSSFFGALFLALTLSRGSSRQTFLNIFYFAEALLVGSWLERMKLRHLHVHFGTAASTVGLIASRAYDVTFSMTIHGPDEFYEVGKYALTEKIEAAQLVCCIGLYARSQLMKLSHPKFWKRLKVAPLGVDTGTFRPRPFRAAPKVFEILCVGRLTSAKGQTILLRAVKALCAEGRSVHCRFVGDGPDRASLKDFAQRELPPGSVTLEGAANQDSVRKYLEEADIFALPSFAEGIPVALMEAMSMEIPCVSTMINGIPELIRHGVDGLLVSPSDDLELADALRLLMDDALLRFRLGAAGRLRVRARYELRDNVAALAEILKCELTKSI